MTAMHSTNREETDSWQAHQAFLQSIERFLAELRVCDREVWIGDVCLGSQDEPRISAPLHRDSAALIDSSLRRAEELATNLTKTLRIALQVTSDRMKILEAKGTINRDDLARAVERIEALQALQRELTAATDGAPAWHPVILSRLHEMLERRLAPGNPAIEVRVTTTYVL